jgi:hypothetical protein
MIALMSTAGGIAVLSVWLLVVFLAGLALALALGKWRDRG